MEDKVILLVEDDPDDESLILRALEKNHIANQIVVAHDGVEALEHLFATSSLPQVVLLDLKLPRLNGLEVLQQLRADERTSLLPIVILTSSDEERDIVESYRLGANSYIHKPIDFTQFADAVRQLGLYWLVLNRPPYRRRGNP